VLSLHSNGERMPLDIGSRLLLNDGNSMPQFGLGVYLTSEGKEIRRAMEMAIAAGYRHFDTAAMYGNEAGVGAAIRESGIPREAFFVTTKLWNDDHGYDSALKAFEKSNNKLDLEYIDLYLIHWPVPGLRRDSWRALEKLKGSGMAKSIGVSNYILPHLQEMNEYSTFKPSVNQIELHPFNFGSRKATIDYCFHHSIVPEAYSPLTRGKKFSDPVVAAAAKSLGKTPSQILIRWSIQHGFSCIPKSSDPDRIKLNADVFGWEIPVEWMQKLDELDTGLAVSWNPGKE